MRRSNNRGNGGRTVTSAFGMMVKVLLRIGLLLTALLGMVLVASAYGGHIDPRISTKPSVLTLALPYLAMTMAVVAVLWLLLRQWRALILAVLSIAVSWPSIRVVCPMHLFPPKVKPEEELLQFKVMTFNAQYFIYNEDEYWRNDNRAFDYLLDCDADLVMIQEGNAGHYLQQMPSVTDCYDKLKSKYPYRADNKKTGNLSILSRYPIEYEDKILDTDSNECAVFYKMKIKGRELHIVNLHLQSLHLSGGDRELYLEYTSPHNMKEKIENRDKFRSSVWAKLSTAFKLRADQADEVRARIEELGENVIVCGDFNDTPCSYAYRTIRGKDFEDTYQDCGFGPEITYHENRFLFKIDHILYRGDMRAVNIERPSVKISDHYPLIATMIWNSKNS